MGDNYPGSPVFNVDHLKKYSPSPMEFGERSVLPPTRLRKPASEEYEVDSIIGHKRDRRTGKLNYLVRWKDYSPLHDSWLPEVALKNAPDVVREYCKLTRP